MSYPTVTTEFCLTKNITTKLETMRFSMYLQPNVKEETETCRMLKSLTNSDFNTHTNEGTIFLSQESVTENSLSFSSFL